jgi:hypothetical protein
MVIKYIRIEEERNEKYSLQVKIRRFILKFLFYTVLSIFAQRSIVCPLGYWKFFIHIFSLN